MSVCVCVRAMGLRSGREGKGGWGGDWEGGDGVAVIRSGLSFRTTAREENRIYTLYFSN